MEGFENAIAEFLRAMLVFPFSGRGTRSLGPYAPSIFHSIILTCSYDMLKKTGSPDRMVLKMGHSLARNMG
jgi:hypothetical protein